MSPEHPYLAAFVAAMRTSELGGDADWRNLADTLWLATSSVATTPSVESETDEGGVSGDGPSVAGRREPNAERDAAPSVGGPSEAIWSAQESAEGWRLAETPVGELPAAGLGLVADLPPWLSLPGHTEIGRALRPLKRREASRRDRVLDVDATVDAFCQSRVLVPVLRASHEPWFEVAVVADANPTMAVWRDTVEAFADLLERHGAFRAVTRWTLVERPSGVMLTSSAGVEHAPQVLADVGARRLVLVVTDAVGDLWRRAAVWVAIQRWGLACPAALVHVLPTRMWRRTATGDADASVRSHRRGEANALLGVRPPWWWGEGRPPGAAIPIVALDEASIAPWAQMVAGVPEVSVPAVLGPLPPDDVVDAVPDGFRHGLDPYSGMESLGDAIRSSVSSTAFRIASLLSAVDASISLARIVMATLVPEARQEHLAELLAVGVLRARVDNADASLEFAPGVRTLLQETLTTTDALMTWRAVTPALVSSGRAPQFALLLAEGAEALGYDAGDPMAGIAAHLAGRLGLIGTVPARGPARLTSEAGATDAPLDLGIGRRLALVAGTADYAHAGLSPLPNVEAGVSLLAEVLGAPERAGFEVSVLRNPSGSELRRRIGSILRAATRDDVVLLSYSGYGMIDEAGELYLPAADEALGQEVGVRARWLRSQILDCAAREVVVLLDCSDSGAFGDAVAAVSRRFHARGNLRVLTSSGAQESAVDSLRSDSFTRAVVDGLRSGEADLDGDGLITLNELLSFVDQRMSGATPGQRPRLWEFASDNTSFPLARSAPPLPTDALAIAEADVVANRQLATSDPAFMPDLAVALRTLGARHSEVGQHRDARAAAEEAVVMYRAMVEGDPTDELYERELGLGLGTLGDLSLAEGDLARAGRDYRAALEIAERLAGAEPTNELYLGDVRRMSDKLDDLATAGGELSRSDRAVRISLCGPRASGKTMFLGALPLAIDQNQMGSWTVTALDAESFDYLTAIRQAMFDDWRLPAATASRTKIRWRIEDRGRKRRFPLHLATRKTRKFDVELSDAPGEQGNYRGFASSELASSDAFIYLLDGARDDHGGGDAAILDSLASAVRASGRELLPGGYLPQYFALCVSKFDSSWIVDLARRGGWLEQDASNAGRPFIADDNAEGFFDSLCDHDQSPEAFTAVRRLVRTNFAAKRTRYYFSSALGFMVPEGEVFSFDDFDLVEMKDGAPSLRSAPRPVNVIEPILDLGRAVDADRSR